MVFVNTQKVGKIKAEFVNTFADYAVLQQPLDVLKHKLLLVFAFFLAFAAFKHKQQTVKIIKQSVTFVCKRKIFIVAWQIYALL